MALSINTNVQALNAQRHLEESQSMLSRSMERLSSGLRINSAKDDAAGLAISDRMNSQVKGLNQAVRNANDGISMAQTAEGATQEVVNLLQSMREISVQASNEVYSTSDRASMQAEVDQLYEEINRIAETTEFNGINLLDGSAGTKNFQVGANAEQTISLSLESVKAQDLNLNGYSALGDLNTGRIDAGHATSAAMMLNGFHVEGTAASMAAASMATLINTKTGDTGVTAEAYNTYTGSANVSGLTTGLNINGTVVSDSANMEELVANINRDVAGVEATLESDGALTLTNDTGDSISVSGTLTNSGLTQARYDGYLSLSSVNNEEIQVEIGSGTTIGDLQAFGLNESTGSDDVVGGEVGASTLDKGDVMINGVEVGKTTGTDAAAKAQAINAISDETGVTADASTRVVYSIDFTNSGSASSVYINGTQLDLTSANLSDDINQVVNHINSNVNGVVASTDDEGHLVLTADSGMDIKVETSGGGFGNFFSAATGVDDSGSTIAATASDTTKGTITLATDDGSDISISSNSTTPSAAATALAKVGMTAQGGSDTAIGSGLNVETTANANNAIERIDEAINQVDSFRGDMGAVQNRLESTISNLSNISENLSAARSRILDADIAQETSQMTKGNILQQAGISILAQANQAPQMALSLLG